ncbi:MAG: hypothetical protein AAFN50_10650, partial [Pseudomonadota bacterium]
MKFLTVLFATGLLAMTGCAHAQADIPSGADWYLHVDLERMRSESPGQPIYAWLRDEVFDDIREDANFDIDREVNSLTAFSVAGAGPVVVVDGDFSQETKDIVMTFIAGGGDIQPLKSSGRQYYRVGNPGGDVEFERSDIDGTIDSLEEGGYVSTAVDGKLLVTASEDQMKALLASKGRIAGTRGNKNAILVLTAEKTILRAGMNSAIIDAGDGDDWDSNILRNTEQIAFLVAVMADKLAVEAQLVATEPAMAESLASIAR